MKNTPQWPSMQELTEDWNGNGVQIVDVAKSHRLWSLERVNDKHLFSFNA